MSTIQQKPTTQQSRVWALFRSSAETDESDAAIEPILDPRLFEYELYRQRARADRTDSGFVFLSFGVSDAGTNGREHNHLATSIAHQVRRRARLSDVVGWDGKQGGRVGVILPCADPNAVHGFISDVEEAFKTTEGHRGKSLPDLACDIFAYPSTGKIEGIALDE